MRVISAVDAVSPAIQRTRDLLFRPFNWGTYLKLGLIAIVTEGLGSNFHSSSGGGHSSSHGPNVSTPFHFAPEWIVVAVFAILFAMILSLLVFYLITRLRFAFFHCLVHNTTEIRPAGGSIASRRCASSGSVWRWILLPDRGGRHRSSVHFRRCAAVP